MLVSGKVRLYYNQCPCQTKHLLWWSTSSPKSVDRTERVETRPDRLMCVSVAVLTNVNCFLVLDSWRHYGLVSNSDSNYAHETSWLHGEKCPFWFHLKSMTMLVCPHSEPFLLVDDPTCGESQFPDAGFDQGSRIIGGWESRENEFPYHVSTVYVAPNVMTMKPYWWTSLWWSGWSGDFVPQKNTGPCMAK